MARKPGNPVVRAVTDFLLERDRLEMRAVNALLAAVEPRRPQKVARRRATRKRTR
jgi:hypothetical protein